MEPRLASHSGRVCVPVSCGLWLCCARAPHPTWEFQEPGPPNSREHQISRRPPRHGLFWEGQGTGVSSKFQEGHVLQGPALQACVAPALTDPAVHVHSSCVWGAAPPG